MSEPARPLSGVTVLVTRAADQAAALADPLVALGARVLVTPAIRFVDPPDWAPADAALRNAPAYRWAIFTSVNGVEAVSRRLMAIGLGWDAFSRGRLVAIGPATAGALRARGLGVEVVPEEFRAEGILEALGAESVAGARVLLARAESARAILPETLRARGAVVDVVAVYRTVPSPPTAEAMRALESAGPALVVTFTSSSTVTSFLEALPEPARRSLGSATLAAIGPITAGTLRAHGLEPAIHPGSFTVPALVEAIREHFIGRPAVQPSPRRPV